MNPHGADGVRADGERGAAAPAGTPGCFHAAGGPQAGNQSLFVGDLPKEATDVELRELFSTCGVVLQASIKRGEVETSCPLRRATAGDKPRRSTGRETSPPWRARPHPSRHDSEARAAACAFCRRRPPGSDAGYELRARANPQAESSPLPPLDSADKHTGRNLGYGFVRMGSCEAAKHAMATLEGHPLQARPIRVRWAQKNSTLAVWDIGPGLTLEALVAIFESYGELDESIMLHEGQDALVGGAPLPPGAEDAGDEAAAGGGGPGGAQRQFAYIRFQRREVAERAKAELNGRPMNGLPIRIAWGNASVFRRSREADGLGGDDEPDGDADGAPSAAAPAAEAAASPGADATAAAPEPLPPAADDPCDEAFEPNAAYSAVKIRFSGERAPGGVAKTIVRERFAEFGDVLRLFLPSPPNYKGAAALAPFGAAAGPSDEAASSDATSSRSTSRGALSSEDGSTSATPAADPAAAAGAEEAPPPPTTPPPAAAAAPAAATRETRPFGLVEFFPTSAGAAHAQVAAAALNGEIVAPGVTLECTVSRPLMREPKRRCEWLFFVLPGLRFCPC